MSSIQYVLHIAVPLPAKLMQAVQLGVPCCFPWLVQRMLSPRAVIKDVSRLPGSLSRQSMKTQVKLLNLALQAGEWRSRDAPGYAACSC